MHISSHIVRSMLAAAKIWSFFNGLCQKTAPKFILDSWTIFLVVRTGISICGILLKYIYDVAWEVLLQPRIIFLSIVISFCNWSCLLSNNPWIRPWFLRKAISPYRVMQLYKKIMTKWGKDCLNAFLWTCFLHSICMWIFFTCASTPCSLFWKVSMPFKLFYSP